MVSRLIFAFIFFLLSTQCFAVLKEKDLTNTLSILRTELEISHKEQEKQLILFKEHNEKIKNDLFSILSYSNQNALMLYSQRHDYIFDLTYACHEATELFKNFQKSSLPYKSYMAQLDTEISRYDSLITSLRTMPTITLGKESHIDRNVCITLATNIRNTLIENKETLNGYIEYYDMTERRLKSLNDYANIKYEEIQRSIFNNGGDNYFTIIKNLGSHVDKTTDTLNEKYHTSSDMISQWDSRMILGLFIVIAFYGLLSITLNILILKYLIPQRLRTKRFTDNKKCITLAATTITFAILIGIIRSTVNQNFIIMASNLLVEYAWLLGVIFISLLLRLDNKEIKSSYRIYAPLITIGFIVISFRIILIPNNLVNLIFPPILLICAIWQWKSRRRYGKIIPQSDRTYATISSIIITTSLVCSWLGYTLMSVQLLIWWIMQLTCILTISCLSTWMHKYYIKNDIKSKPINQTWHYYLVYSVILPLLGLFSVIISVYWAASVFNLSVLSWEIFTHRFINMENFSISIMALVIVISLWFIARYVCKTSIALLRHHYHKSNHNNADSRNMVGKNVIQIFVWGIWFLVSLAILRVSNTWLVVISGGLSTGIGFASKDILENLYYGVSLMAGRIKIGDLIECDGTRGKVSNISYTSTMIEALDGSVIAFQNSQLFTKNYKNLTRNHGYEIDSVVFGVAYGSDVRNVCSIISKAVTDLNLPYLEKDKPINVVMTELADSSINFKLIFSVDVTKRTFAKSDIIQCIYETLNANNIEIPYPQSDIRIRQN